MSLIPTATLIGEAVASGSAVPSFNVITLEHAEAVAAGAEAAEVAVLFQVSQNAIRYHGAPEPLLLACRTIAEQSSGRIGLHVDHVTDAALIDRLLDGGDLGIGSLMYDGAALPWEHNVETTATVARRGRERGWWVEAELGEIGGKDGAHAPGVRTDPAEAAAFAGQTGVDGLAVAVGSSHAMRDRSASLDLALIAELSAAVPVPLVLHGSSGVDDDQLSAAVAAGIRKVNIGTALNLAATEALRTWLEADPDAVDPRAYGRVVRDAMSATVTSLARVVAGRE